MGHLGDMTNETQANVQPKARAAIIPVTAFEQNCTLIWCEATGRGVVIDPGGDVPRATASAVSDWRPSGGRVKVSDRA